jgi:hypothetical protein
MMSGFRISQPLRTTPAHNLEDESDATAFHNVKIRPHPVILHVSAAADKQRVMRAVFFITAEAS